MIKGLNRLTARGLAALTDRGRYADGGGLYLTINKHGSRQWVFLFQIDGKRSEMTLGGVASVPLAKAREIAAQCRADVSAGRNPLEQRRAAQAAQQATDGRGADAEVQAAAEAERTKRTFRAVADTMLASKEAGWRNDKHRAQWRTTLKTYAAKLSDMDVADIKTEHVLACLQPIWSTKPETASRVRGRIEAVLNAARAHNLIPDDRANPARWRGHLDHLLAKRPKLSRGHFAALPWREVPSFIHKLREREAIAARALEFAILTAARSGEVRGIRWDEVDFDNAVWIVPAERMKAAREHRVPLSKSALATLKTMGDPREGELVFPNSKGRAHSDMVFKALLDRMNATNVTAHGFRSSFRDWAGDATHFAREDIEAALAHTISNKAEAAYRRSDALEKRRAIMEAWANHCEPRAGNVVALPRQA